MISYKRNEPESILSPVRQAEGGKDDVKKRKTLDTDKPASAKKKASEDKKFGFERNLEPDKILGMYKKRNRCRFI
jgi:hypothetical protein